MKLFIVLFVGLGSLTAHAGQVGSGNVSNEKMCVCEPCGGKMVPCRETEQPYVQEKFQSTSTGSPEKATKATSESDKSE